MTVDLKDFLAGYLAEVEEHSSSATQNLVAVDAALRRGETDRRAVRELFRSLHTIKGLSAMVGIEPVVDVAHAMETLLRAADRTSGRLDATALDVLSAGLRAIEQRVGAVRDGRTVPAAPAALIDRLNAVHAGGGAGAGPSVAEAELVLPAEVADKVSPAEREQLARGIAAGRRAVRLDFVPSPSRAATGVNITSVRERLTAIAEIVKVVPLSRPRSDDAPGGLAFAILLLSNADDGALADAAAATSVTALSSARAAPVAPLGVMEEEEALPTRGSARLVRVDVARLDDAMEKLSALVVNRFRINRAVTQLRDGGADVRAIVDIMNENGRQLRDLRAAIMRARMVPMAELLERIPLLVRGLERATGKQVRLELDSGRAELDKAVAERLFPAIVHLVRNAVDHAIELPDERRQAGKPEAGQLRVSCFERGNNQLELRIEDDGRGIDRQRVTAKAGRPVADGDDALLAVLTQSGFSTRDEVSATSGRGLGMDIVKRIAVDELGGELRLATTLGRGTTFTLRVPLTITIVDAFSFVAAEQPFVAPVAAVDEILEIDPGKLVRGPALRRHGAEISLYDRRGEAVPLVALDRLFAIGSEGAPRPHKALLVRRNGEPFAFLVDRLLSRQEVVVRPIDDPLVRVVGVSGSTDLGDGKPTLVLDLLALSSALSAEARA